MRLDDGTILMHGRAPYDPVKAHEYYMRTRKLKGRKKGSSTYTLKSSTGSEVTLTSKQLAAQKANAAERIAELQKKLTNLNSIIKVAMLEAADNPETNSSVAELQTEIEDIKKHLLIAVDIQRGLAGATKNK